MKNTEKSKNCIFLEKVLERPGKAPGGLRRAPEGPRTIFCAWNATLENMNKFTEECFAPSLRETFYHFRLAHDKQLFNVELS